MKVVINRCFGSFSLSNEACEMLNCDKYDYFYDVNDDYIRANANLISVVESLGCEKASGYMSKLQIVEIPDETTDFMISDYDGVETLIYVVDGKIYTN